MKSSRRINGRVHLAASQLTQPRDQAASTIHRNRRPHRRFELSTHGSFASLARLSAPVRLPDPISEGFPLLSILQRHYLWYIELLFRFLKRTLSGIHLIRHDQRGVTIQFWFSGILRNNHL
jgi:hypothetical protein